MSLEDATARAHEVLGLYREGIDPHEKETQERVQAETERALEKALGVTLSELVESFLHVRRPKSDADYRNTLEVCFGDWLSRPVRSITRQDVEDRYHQIAFEEGKKAQAVKAMRYLSSIMNFAKAETIEGQQLIIESPVAVLKDKKIDRTIKSRDRHIEPEQLFAFVRGLITECSPTVRDLLLLMLMSGLRDKEAKGLRWADVDFRKKWFTVRETKNRTDHTMPMSRLLYAMLVARFHTRTSDEWVFPSRLSDGHIQDIRRQMSKVTAKTGIEFTAHDLRRTFTTLLHRLNAGAIAIQRLMNHKNKNITQAYIQTKAAAYTEPMNRLYKLIASNHDWATDAGQYRLAENTEWMDDEETVEHLLHYVLYGETLGRLIRDGVRIDLDYIDPDYHPVRGTSWEQLKLEHQASKEMSLHEWDEAD